MGKKRGDRPGWDSSPRPLWEAVRSHGVLGEEIWAPLSEALRGMEILEPPAPRLGLSGQVNRLVRDMEGFRERHPRARMVLVNLLPACASGDLRGAVQVAPGDDELKHR